METTVSMSLDRYQALESQEKALQEILKSPDKCFKIRYDMWIVNIDSGNSALMELAKQLKLAIDARDIIIQKVRDYEQATGKKVY